MMMLMRRSLAQPLLSAFAAAALVAAAWMPTQALAQKKVTTWRVQSHWPAASSSYKDSLALFKQRLEERTDGRLVLEPHAAGALFPAGEIYDAVRRGILPMGTISPSYITERHSLAGIAAGLPFAFRELWEAIYFYRNLGFEQMLRDEIAKDGVFYFTEKLYSTEMVLRRPVSDLADFRKLRIRSAGTLQKFLSEAGAATQAVPGPEIYPALSQGVIDGAHWGAAQGAASMSLYEVAKYHVKPALTITGVDAFIFNQKAVDALPEDVRKIFMDTLQDQFWHRTIEYEYKEQITLARAVQKQNVQVYRLPEDVQQSMTKAASKVWEAEAKRGPQAAKAMEMMRSFLGDLGYL
jgi:TRAP-type mannitol/chloroaromatic compound transport system substrate-binding protein